MTKSLQRTESDVDNFSILNVQKFQDIKILILNKGEIFGQNDVISNKNYSTTVKCVMKGGAVLRINAQE